MLNAFSQEFLESIKLKKQYDIVEISCPVCDVKFNISVKDLTRRLSINQVGIFCSLTCSGAYKTKTNTVSVKCNQCDKLFLKKLCKIKLHVNNFCSSSCAATYNNTHKTKGYRRSKLEIWLESQLPGLYPNTKILFNDKKTINSELDIYIPSLKLAFELNGIFHYEPIYGKEQLEKIINNDGRKFQACLEQGIELVIIDTSKQSYFKVETSKKYLNIITNIINLKLNQK